MAGAFGQRSGRTQYQRQRLGSGCGLWKRQQLGNSPYVSNAYVCSPSWGAEELVAGSRNRCRAAGHFKGIALYLNFDMLASPNPGYFTP